jgi:hypothetical protein
VRGLGGVSLVTALVQLSVGMPAHLYFALGGLIDTAVGGGTVLAPGSHPSASAELRLPEGLSLAEAALRLGRARAALEVVEYAAPEPVVPGEEVTVGHLKATEDGVSIGVGVDRELHEKASIALIAAFKPALDNQEAPNYVEFGVIDPSSADEKYVVIVCRPGGKTPHELRREAEAELERLRSPGAEMYEKVARFMRLNYTPGSVLGEWEHASKDERDAWLAEAARIVQMAVSGE